MCDLCIHVSMSVFNARASECFTLFGCICLHHIWCAAMQCLGLIFELPA